MEAYHFHRKSVKFPHYRFNATPIKILARFFFFIDIDELILKFTQKGTDPRK